MAESVTTTPSLSLFYRSQSRHALPSPHFPPHPRPALLMVALDRPISLSVSQHVWCLVSSLFSIASSCTCVSLPRSLLPYLRLRFLSLISSLLVLLRLSEPFFSFSFFVCSRLFRLSGSFFYVFFSICFFAFCLSEFLFLCPFFASSRSFSHVCFILSFLSLSLLVLPFISSSFHLPNCHLIVLPHLSYFFFPFFATLSFSLSYLIPSLSSSLASHFPPFI